MPFDGLSPIVCGVLGYVSIILYDLNNVTHNNDRMQSLYTVGAGLIGLAFFSTVLPGLSEPNSLPAAVRVIAGILALGFFVLLIYLTFITGGRTNWKVKEALVGKGSRNDGRLRSLPPPERLGHVLFLSAARSGGEP